jgi:hypothetical protein
MRFASRRFVVLAQRGQQQHQVLHHRDVLRLACQRHAEGALGQLAVAVALVDHAQRVVGDDEGRIVRHRRARPPVGVVDAALQQRLDGPVVHVHRHDGVFFERKGAVAGHLFGWQEVDRQRAFGLDRAWMGGRRLAEAQVDVAASQVKVAAAAPGVVDHHGLVIDAQAQFLGERRRHDHQRQAVAAERLEGLGGVARHGRFVFELQLALLVERVDQALFEALGAQLRAERGAVQVAAHRRADGEQVVGADALGRRGECGVAEQLQGCGRRWRRAGAACQQQGDDEGRQRIHAIEYRATRGCCQSIKKAPGRALFA